MASTHTETRTRAGRCATHGHVTAVKSVPQVRFPFVVWLVRRWIALAQPYRCPTCAAKVSISERSAGTSQPTATRAADSRRLGPGG